ncbi:phosphatidylinositol-4,5-diphosphate 3-kinase [Pelomyxa schiedti]|nr:phosphatidylinositol-4,5-diphosphate 3-kinase [Pelomyxa schiedti]
MPPSNVRGVGIVRPPTGCPPPAVKLGFAMPPPPNSSPHTAAAAAASNQQNPITLTPPHGSVSPPLDTLPHPSLVEAASVDDVIEPRRGRVSSLVVMTPTAQSRFIATSSPLDYFLDNFEARTRSCSSASTLNSSATSATTSSTTSTPSIDPEPPAEFRGGLVSVGTAAILYRDTNNLLKAFSYPSTDTIQTMLTNAVRDFNLDPAKVYCLGIPEIDLFLGREFGSLPMTRVSFPKMCLMAGIQLPFEICEEQPTMHFVSDLQLLEKSFAESPILELVGTAYASLLRTRNLAVTHERCVLAKMRLAGKFAPKHPVSKFVYIGSEPPLRPPTKMLKFDVKCPHLAVSKGMACKADTLISELTNTVFEKFRVMCQDKLVGLTAADFILKVHGSSDYLEPTDEDNHPTVLGDFDYVRKADFKGSPIELSYVLKPPPKSTTTGDFDIHPIVDKLLAREDWQDIIESNEATTSILEITAPLSVKVSGITNLKWPLLFDEKGKQLNTPPPQPWRVYVAVGLYHCGQPITSFVFSPITTYPSRDNFAAWSNFMACNIQMRCIPKEARIYFMVYASGDDPSRVPLGTVPLFVGNKDTALGWVGMHLLNYKSVLISGKFQCKLWEGFANPIGVCVENTGGKNPPVLALEFEPRPQKVVFPPPEVFDTVLATPVTPLAKLTEKAARHLKILDDQDPLLPLQEEDKDFLWEWRQFFVKSKPAVLAKLMRCVKWQIPEQACEAHRLLKAWPALPPTAALELLDAKFADEQVRQYAIRCLDVMPDTEVSDFLLQLTQVLKYEPHHGSDLSRFLLTRALQNKNRVGHMFFWYLKAEMHVETISERFGILLEAFLRGCGSYRTEIEKQHNLLKDLERVARMVKTIPKEERTREAREALARLTLPQEVQLPLDPRYIQQA